MNITATLIAQMIAFVLLIWFVNKVLWGPMSAMLAERQKRIADGLAAAEKGKHDLELAEKHAKEELQAAKAKAAEIMAQAEKRANAIVDEARVHARAEGDRQLAAAQAEIERETNRAKEQLRGQVASVAMAGAARILKREIDAKSHGEVLNDVIAQI
ncbi:MAG: F0F1 ATP synthase subunit B [Gammaproteobacteria bacterium]|nr:F0F1 ATP synthase subunit B [Gammaproteobacteria bacterium]